MLNHFVKGFVRISSDFLHGSLTSINLASSIAVKQFVYLIQFIGVRVFLIDRSNRSRWRQISKFDILVLEVIRQFHRLLFGSTDTTDCTKRDKQLGSRIKVIELAVGLLAGGQGLTEFLDGMQVLHCITLTLDFGIDHVIPISNQLLAVFDFLVDNRVTGLFVQLGVSQALDHSRPTSDGLRVGDILNRVDLTTVRGSRDDLIFRSKSYPFNARCPVSERREIINTLCHHTNVLFVIQIAVGGLYISSKLDGKNQRLNSLGHFRIRAGSVSVILFVSQETVDAEINRAGALNHQSFGGRSGTIQGITLRLHQVIILDVSAASEIVVRRVGKCLRNACGTSQQFTSIGNCGRRIENLLCKGFIILVGRRVIRKTDVLHLITVVRQIKS